MFLKCKPTVFVIDNEYEILIYAKQNGLFSVTVGNERYYPENSGVLDSEKPFAKIRIPQSALNEAKKYTVCYRETVKRQPYYSQFKDEETQEFAFRPLEKTDDIRIYHIADVHYLFEDALLVGSYFGDDLDFLIVNGDIGEVETEENYFDVIRFVGEASRGEIPTLFVRGNHDTRGKLAELYTDYFPANGKNTYFTFELGALCGVVFDCGEDKVDEQIEYGGSNAFEPFRRRQTAWLKSVELPQGKIPFAVGHIIPVQTTRHAGDPFDIERDIYTEWNAQFERLGVKLMLCGHMHDAYVLQKNDERSLIKHNYPVVVGSKQRNGELWGTAITVKNGEIRVCFTDKNHEIKESYIL